MLRPYDVHSAMGAALMHASNAQQDPLVNAAAVLTGTALLMPRRRRHGRELEQASTCLLAFAFPAARMP